MSNDINAEKLRTSMNKQLFSMVSLHKTSAFSSFYLKQTRVCEEKCVRSGGNVIS